MYKLTELEIKNFRSYKHLHLKDIDKMGLTLISGENGSGKSAIRNAIEYLLVDTTSENITLKELTFNEKGNCTLRCVITNSAGDEICITKYRDHKKYVNKVIFSVNGIEDGFTESDRRETQKNINNYFKLNKDILSISTIFSQKSLSFPEATESDRKKVIYSAKDLGKYNEYYLKAKEKVDGITKEIEGKEIRLPILSDTIEEIGDNLKELVQKELKSHGNKVGAIVKLQKNLKSIRNTYKEELEFKIKKLEKAKPKFQCINKLVDQRKKLEDKLKTTEEEQTRQILLENKIEELKEDRIRLNTEIGMMEITVQELDTNICPILKQGCGLLIIKNKELREAGVNQLFKLKDKYDKVICEINRYKDEIIILDEVITDNDAIMYTINDIKLKIDKWESSNLEIYGIQLQIDDTNKQWDIWQEEKIKDINIRIEDLKKEENPYKKLVEKCVDSLKIKKKEYSKLKDKLDNLYKKLQHYNFWKKGYSKSGIPNMKAESFLEELEIETNTILSDIADNLYIEIDSQTELQDKSISEKIEYKIFHPEKSINNFWSFSGGQRQRINLASMLAFNKILSKFGFVFMDEVLELSLDDKGKEEILDCLRKKSSDFDTLFVISHSKNVQDKFDNIINVKLEEGVSKICE